MVSSGDFGKAVGLIGRSSNVLVTTHARPDGDACGCVAVMSEVLAGLGKKVKPILLPALPGWYEFLFDARPGMLGEDISIEQLKDSEFDLIIIVDTNTYNQLPQFDEYLKSVDTPVLVIDHHATADGLGEVELVDTGAAATALIVLDLLRYGGWEVSEKIARALFVAVATDTGWFQFGNTDSRAFKCCGELIEAGANPTELYRRLYQNFSPQRFALMTAMLDTLELHLDRRYATQHLLKADFKRTGAAYSDTENLIDECRRIRSVEAAALFVERADGRIKVSLRSMGGISVRKIAQRLGGGGHDAAAGVHLAGPLEEAKRLIYEAMAEQFAQIDRK